jgi:hypothetical protein
MEVSCYTPVALSLRKGCESPPAESLDNLETFWNRWWWKSLTYKTEEHTKCAEGTNNLLFMNRQCFCTSEWLTYVRKLVCITYLCCICCSLLGVYFNGRISNNVKGKNKDVWSDHFFPLFLCGLFYDTLCLSDSTASVIEWLTDSALGRIWKEAFMGW